MPAKDLIHDAVCNALENDGWTITHEHMKVEFEDAFIYVDLGAERMVIAQRANEKIAVEVKSFLGKSAIQDIEDALGQFVVYRIFLRKVQPERHLFLCVSHITFDTIFSSKAIQILIDELNVSLLVVNVETEEVDQWIKR
ncbi:MAG: XisH family protein [Caldilineaceae bacterium]|nr:XisH family protein [Caldilineaceae bacterium]